MFGFLLSNKKMKEKKDSQCKKPVVYISTGCITIYSCGHCYNVYESILYADVDKHVALLITALVAPVVLSARHVAGPFGVPAAPARAEAPPAGQPAPGCVHAVRHRRRSCSGEGVRRAASLRSLPNSRLISTSNDLIRPVSNGRHQHQHH